MCALYCLLIFPETSSLQGITLIRKIGRPAALSRSGWLVRQSVISLGVCVVTNLVIHHDPDEQDQVAYQGMRHNPSEIMVKSADQEYLHAVRMQLPDVNLDLIDRTVLSEII